MLRHKKHELSKTSSLDMTPLIDVVFQLLLFFMLTSSLVRPNQIELDLPESTSGVKAQEEQILVVAYRVTPEGVEILLNEEPVASLKELGKAMSAAIDPQQQPRVDIRIDRAVPYQDVIAVMDSVRDAGYPRFSLLTLASSGGGG